MTIQLFDTRVLNPQFLVVPVSDTVVFGLLVTFVWTIALYLVITTVDSICDVVRRLSRR